MALQTSGTISMGQIYDEISDSTRPSPIGLLALENGTYRPLTRYPTKPSGNTPSGMGEWYGYQGGHIINIEISGSTFGISDFNMDYFSDDNNTGYEMFSGTATSGITMLYPENPLFLYSNLTSGVGSIYFYFWEANCYVSSLGFYDSNNNHLTSNYSTFIDGNNGYIYYYVDTGQFSAYYTVKFKIDFY